MGIHEVIYRTDDLQFPNNALPSGTKQGNIVNAGIYFLNNALLLVNQHILNHPLLKLQSLPTVYIVEDQCNGYY